MRNTTRMGAVLATAAAVAFFTPTSADSFPDNSFPIDRPGTPTQFKCEGGNACRGQSLCKGIANACATQNDCKGNGWILVLGATREEASKKCTEAGGRPVFF